MKIRPSFWVSLLLVALLGLAFQHFFELDAETDREDIDPQVGINPFLAAGRLLQASGFAVSSQPTLERIPGEAGTIIATQPTADLGTAGVIALRRWVEAGNQLITTAPASWLERNAPLDPLLGPLGVVRREYRPPPKKMATLMKDSAFQATTENGLSWMRMPDDSWLQLGFSPFDYLDDTRHLASLRIDGPLGAQALAFPVGRGRIVVLSSFDVFDSRPRIGGRGEITQGDNAALLLFLVGARPQQPVWIFFEQHYPSLLHVLWQVARPALVAALVLVLCWLWWGGRRFGPLLPALRQPRRRLAEHLLASGRYLWHAGQQERLYKMLRASLRRHLLSRHGELRQLSPEQLAEELAQRAGLPPAQVRQALLSAPTKDSNRFLADVRTLQALRTLAP